MMVLRVWVVIFLALNVGFSASDRDERLSSKSFRTSIQAPDLFDRIAETSSSVRDLSAEVDFKVRLYNIGITFDVGGDYYYKQPEKTRLKLREIPDFLLSRQSDAFKTTNILAGLRRDLKEQYQTKIVNQTSLHGENCYIVQLVPKKEDGVARILLWVNSINYTMPQVIIHYENGANLTQRKSYVKAGDVFVVEKMDSDYNSPDMKAEILATFRNYQINKGLADTLFEHSKSENNLVSIF